MNPVDLQLILMELQGRLPAPLDGRIHLTLGRIAGAELRAFANALGIEAKHSPDGVFLMGRIGNMVVSAVADND